MLTADVNNISYSECTSSFLTRFPRFKTTMKTVSLVVENLSCENLN